MRIVMIRHTLVVFLCLSAAVSALAGGFSQEQGFRAATPEELAMKGVPGDDGAEAAILDWVRVDDDKASVSSEYLRIKIFTEAGVRHSDVELPYVTAYPLREKIDDISARTIRPDGTTVPFDGKVYDKVLVKVGRDAVKAKTFTLTDVKPGSIIEYRFIRRRGTPRYLFNTHWGVQREIPIVHAHFTLQPYDGEGQYSNYFTYMGLPPGVFPEKIGKAYELDIRNMPALRTEAFMPPERQVRAKVEFVYTARLARPEEFWTNEAPVIAKEIDKFMNAKEAKAEAAKLSEGVTDRRAVLEKLYAHVQSFRNYSFESSKTEQEVERHDLEASRNAGEVLRKKAGFADEINRAFVALARAAGFEADAVRVAPRSEVFFSDKLPDVGQMSGEVAMVMLDGKPLYLDPGTPGAPFGILSWEKSNVTSIQAAKGGKAIWGNVPGQTPEDAITRRKADLTLNGDVLEGKVTITFAGQEALVRRLATLNDDEAARKKAIEDEIKELFPEGATLKLAQLTGHGTSHPELTASFDVTLPNIVSAAGSRVVLPISIFAAQATNPFAPTTRTNMIYFPYESQEVDEVRLTIPDGVTVATLPSPKQLDVGLLNYKAATTREGNVVTFSRTATYKAMLVDVKHYNALRKFFSSMTAADQQPLVLATGGAK
ncbi:MAG: hypothetical protein QOJ98_3418 [Acidobacteriota bacterium]|nr:hypothetical protein [Acidobacteriota bacterium]